MNYVVTVLKSGGVYLPEHVGILSRNVAQHMSTPFEFVWTKFCIWIWILRLLEISATSFPMLFHSLCSNPSGRGDGHPE